MWQTRRGFDLCRTGRAPHCAFSAQAKPVMEGQFLRAISQQGADRLAPTTSRFALRASFVGCLLAAFGLVLAAGVPARANPILLVEADTGRVIEQKEAGRPWHPASVTKLMTVYVALNAVRNGRLKFDTPITVSPAAAAQQPSKMGFKVGTVVTLDNALKMVLVKSANDMAWLVGEGVAGSMPAFVAEMNATAAHLGMTGTHFENPNGLPDPAQVTTARDLAILARAIIYHFPEQEALFRIPAIKIGKVVLRNYNRLIDRYPGADGMKTGFVCGSGYNLVATATRGNKRLIAVILGARSGTARTEQAALMFEKGFQSSWSVFGAAAPLLSALPNSGGPIYDMRAEVCGGKRAVTASEADDEPDPQTSSSFSFATPALPKSGAELCCRPCRPPCRRFRSMWARAMRWRISPPPTNRTRRRSPRPPPDRSRTASRQPPPTSPRRVVKRLPGMPPRSRPSRRAPSRPAALRRRSPSRSPPPAPANPEAAAPAPKPAT